MRYLYTFLLAVPCLLLIGQVEHLSPQPYSSDFSGIYVDANGTGFVVGSCGVALKTTDGGQNWTQVSLPQDDILEAVSCRPGTGCAEVFIGGKNFIYSSTDSGESWSVFEMNLSRTGVDIYFPDETSVFYGRRTPTQWYSTDNGQSWSSVSINPQPSGGISFPGNQVGFITNDNPGKVLKTEDGGQTWNEAYTHPTFINQLSMVDGQNGFLSDNTRTLYQTTDGGITWSEVGPHPSINAIYFEAQSMSTIDLFGSSIFNRTTDGGQSWTEINTIENTTTNRGTINANTHRSGTNYWFASPNTEIIRSTDDLATLQNTFLDLRTIANQIEFAEENSEIGYIIDGANRLLRSDDEGENWTEINLSDAPAVLSDVYAISDEEAIVTYTNRPPMRTIDGFNTTFDFIPTSITDTLTNGSLRLIERASTGRWGIFGTNHYLYSDDDGQSWTVVFHGLNFNPNFLSLNGNESALIGGTLGRLLRSTDGGLSWQTTDALPAGSIFAYGLDLGDGRLLAGPTSQLARSTDGGQSWSTDGIPSATRRLALAPNADIYTYRATSEGNFIYRSTDQGDSWEELSRGCTSYDDLAVNSDGSFLYLAGSGLRVDRLLIGPSSIAQVPNSAQIEPLIVYPNPTNGLIYLDFRRSEHRGDPRLAGAEHYGDPRPAGAISEAFDWQLFDASGKLVSQGQLPANNQPSLSLAGLASGMYHLRVFGRQSVSTARVIVR